jgi:hypothetical protein
MNRVQPWIIWLAAGVLCVFAGAPTLGGVLCLIALLVWL